MIPYEHYDELKDMIMSFEGGSSLWFDLDNPGRDEITTSEERYAVYEQDDIEQLIERLSLCMNK